jgi:hypothetical protein
MIQDEGQPFIKFPAIVALNGALSIEIRPSGILPEYNNRQSGDNCRHFHILRYQKPSNK